jgi:hypothetical protein
MQGPQWDSSVLELSMAQWERAVKESGYVAAQETLRDPTAGG